MKIKYDKYLVIIVDADGLIVLKYADCSLIS